MSLTVTAKTPDAVKITDTTARWDGTITADSSYPTDGYEMPTNFKIKNKFKTVLRVTVEPIKGYDFYYESSTDKLKVFVAGIEVSNGYDLSSIDGARITAEGFIQ